MELEKNGTKDELVKIAYQKALKPFHGDIENNKTNLEPIIKLFPRWNLFDANNKWCAAFVYYCLKEAGFKIPYSPDECITCSLAGCGGFEEFAIADERIEYHKTSDGYRARVGDIVIYDHLFEDKEHDHIGIVLNIEDDYLIVAEGNIPYTNTSGVIKRKLDEHIRCFITIPDGYQY